MSGFKSIYPGRGILRTVGGTSLFVLNAFAQYGGGTMGSGTTGGSGPSVYNFHGNYHVGFDSPEGWGLKYFASTTLLNGLQPPAEPEEYHVGSVNVGLELGWLPTLDAGQRQIGFKGTTPEDLNKSQVLIRPVVRVGLPDKF